jgi:hypothetical protein
LWERLYAATFPNHRGIKPLPQRQVWVISDVLVAGHKKAGLRGPADWKRCKSA